MIRRAKLPLLAALGALAPAAARAQTPPRAQVSLAWSAPAECPARDDVLALVDRLRTPSPSQPPRASLAAASVTHRDDGRWWLDLQTASTDGVAERTLVADSCAHLAEAAALILALALDGPAAPPPPPVAPRPAPPPPPRREAPTPIGLALRGSFVIDGGSLPGAASGGGLTLAVVRGSLRVEAAASYLFPRHAVTETGAGGDIALFSAALRGCGVLLRGPIEPRLCGAVEGGAMLGTGTGVANPASGGSPWWALSATAALAWNLSPHLSLHLGVDLGVPLSAPDFVVDNVGLVFRPGAVFVRGTTGVEWRF